VLKRKGIALISVVLISVLVFVSIIGIVLKVVPEKSISNARISSERALSAAEAGLSQVVFDLRNMTFSNGGSIGPSVYYGTHYVTVSEAANIVKNPGSVVDLKESNTKSITLQDYPNVTYWAQVKADSSVTPWDPFTGDPKNGYDVPVIIYVLGTAYNNSSHTFILARKAIMVDYTIIYSKTSEFISGPETGAFKYALFSGTSLVFQGASQVITGDVFSNGDIVLNAKEVKDRVLNGKAYLNGDLYYKDNKPPITDPNAFPKTEENPELKGAHYIWLSNQFKTGSAPYNGATVTDKDGIVIYVYPNVSSLSSIIQSNDYLGPAGSSSTIDGIQRFYSDLMNNSGGFAGLLGPLYDAREALKEKISSAVYYIEGDAIINGNFTCEGAIYIHGDLHLNGGAEIYNPGGLAIFVDGRVLANGNAYVEGLLFTTKDIYGTGSFASKGSIVALGGLNVNGSLDVTYSDINMPNTDTGNDTEEVESVIEDVKQGEFTWKEISYDEFLSPQ